MRIVWRLFWIMLRCPGMSRELVDWERFASDDDYCRYVAERMGLRVKVVRVSS